MVFLETNSAENGNIFHKNAGKPFHESSIPYASLKRCLKISQSSQIP